METPEPKVIQGDFGLSGRELFLLKETLPLPSDPRWVRYENALEQKWAFNDFSKLPAWQRLLASCTSPRHDFGIKDLHADLTQHGAGAHLMRDGDHLGVHLDYARRPNSDFERRANLILFLTSAEAPLCFYSPLGQEIMRIDAEEGKYVMWEASDIAYHGVPYCHGYRLTFACYYLSPLRPGVTRQRALFLPPR